MMAPSMDFVGGKGHRPNGLAFLSRPGVALVRSDDADLRLSGYGRDTMQVSAILSRNPERSP